MKIERTKNTIRNISWGYIYRIIAIVLPFLFRTTVIKCLGAEYLGVSSLFTSILQVLSLSELGFGTAIVYSMYKPIAENNDVQVCALLRFYKRIYFVIGIVVFAVGIIILPFIPHLITGGYPSDLNIYFVYVMFLLNTVISYFLFAYKSSLLSAFQRNDLESKALIVISLFRYAAEIIGLYITRQYYLFLCVEVISTILLNFVKLFIVNKNFPQYSCKGEIDDVQKKEIKDNVLALMCHKIGGTILNSADNIVLSAFMGVVVVSNFGNYYYIMNAVESVVIICFAGMTAGIGNSFVTETVEKNRDYFRKVLFFNAWIVCMCSACFVCLYQDFMQLWVGKEYMFTDSIVALFVLYFFTHCIRRTIIVFRDGAGMWQDNKWQPIVSALFNLVVNIILVNIIGVAGILISSILSMFLIDIPWETKAFCKRIDMRGREYILLLVKYLLITIGVCAGLYIGTSLFNLPLIISLLVKGILAVVFSNMVLWILFRRTNEFDYFSALIGRYLKKFKRVYCKRHELSDKKVR